MLAALLKSKGVKRNITFRSVDISAGGEDSFNRVFSKTLDYAEKAIDEASFKIEREKDLLPVFKGIKSQCLAYCGRIAPEIATILTKEATFHGSKIAANVKSKAGVDVTVLMQRLTQDLTAIISQAQAQLETVVLSFVNSYQNAVLDFRAIGYVRDEAYDAGGFEEERVVLKRLKRREKERARQAAKRAARNTLGNANAKNAKAANESLGLNLYVWRTMLDDRVRASHEEREGVIFNYLDPPEGGNPGEDWGCRCIAAPFYGGKSATTDKRPNFRCD